MVDRLVGYLALVRRIFRLADRGLVHVALLASARNRLSVMVEWVWAYPTYRRSIRLITRGGN